jgi:hypothetical protein
MSQLWHCICTVRWCGAHCLVVAHCSISELSLMQEPTGFKLTKADAVAYSKWVAKAVHDRGMVIGCVSTARHGNAQARHWAASQWPALLPRLTTVQRTPYFAGNTACFALCDKVMPAVPFDSSCGAAHARCTGCRLKNTLGLLPELHQDYDFFINEQCSAWNECSLYRWTPMRDALKL